MSIGLAPDARTAPKLTLKERDRRWGALRRIMREHSVDCVIVGSFQGRERLESYLIDDFLDSIVVFPLESEPVVLSFATARISRSLESQRRGEDLWVADYRVGFGGAAAAAVIAEKGCAAARVGIVGLGPTAPGEMEGLLPLGFWENLRRELPRASFEDMTQAFTDLVLVKSEEELALLRYAAGVSERACQAMIEATAPEASEADIYASIMSTIYRHGCDVRYPFLSLQSGPSNIGWGPPRWLLRAEPPRRIQAGDMVQAEIHTCYGGQEAQVQMSIAVEPVDDLNRRAEEVVRQAYEVGVRAVRPGVPFADVVRAMEAPVRDAGCWSKTPLAHTLTFGSTGFTAVNREQLRHTPEWPIEGQARPGIRRPEVVLEPGMGLELEPNACIGLHRVNIGGSVLVTDSGCEELSDLPTRVFHLRG